MPGAMSVNFEGLGFDPSSLVVRDIYIEDSIGPGIPVCRVSLVINQKKGVSGDQAGEEPGTSKAAEQSEFNIQIGFRDIGIFKWGPFLVEKPKIAFRGRSAPSEIQVIGLGFAVRLGHGEKRVVYNKMSDAQIASAMAGAHGLKPEIGHGDGSDRVYDRIIQANESDWDFLWKRARLHGFMVYVNDERRELHFHKPTSKYGDIKTLFTFNIPGNVVLEDFVVRTRPINRGLDVIAHHIDPFLKEPIDVIGLHTEKDAGLFSSLDPGPLTAISTATSTALGSTQSPNMMLTNEGQRITADEMEDMAKGVARSLRYVIAGRGVTSGAPQLKAGDQVLILGAGAKSDGFYLCTRVMHHIGEDVPNGAFQTIFDCIRTGANDTGSPTPITPVIESVVRAR